jgi:hypothetical protein
MKRPFRVPTLRTVSPLLISAMLASRDRRKDVNLVPGAQLHGLRFRPLHGIPVHEHVYELPDLSLVVYNPLRKPGELGVQAPQNFGQVAAGELYGVSSFGVLQEGPR